MSAKAKHFPPVPVMQIVVMVAALTLPATIYPFAFHAFELPKALLLRALLFVVLAASSLSISVREPHRRKPSVLTVAAILFGAVLVAATLRSDHRSVAFWGTYERQYGLFTVGGQLVLFLAVTRAIRERQDVLRLWDALVWGSAPVVGYGLLQAVSLDPFAWQTDGTSRVMAMLGRSNFLGSYLVMVMPLTASRWVGSRRRWPLSLLLVGQLAAILLTRARAAWLGLGAAGLIFVLMAVDGKWRLWLGRSVLLLAALLILLLGSGTLAQRRSPLGALPGAEHVLAVFDLGAGSPAARRVIWRTLVPLVAERPLLGYGPDTLRLVFAPHFPPELVYYQGRGLEVDRAHNLWLDLAMSSGLAGVTAFLLVLATFGGLVWRNLRHSDDQRTRPMWIGLIALVIGHIVELQFAFETVATGSVFWLALGLAVALDRVGRSAAGKPTQASLPAVPPRPLRALPVLSLGIVTVGLILTFTVRPLLADLAYRDALDSDLSAQVRLSAARRAVRYWPVETAYRLGLAEVLAAQGNFPEADAHLAEAIRRQPADPQLWVAAGRIHMAWGAVTPAHLTVAQSAYLRALALSPNTATIHAALGAAYAAQGRIEQAIARTERAVALDATDPVAYSQLSGLYAQAGLADRATWAESQARSWTARLTD